MLYTISNLDAERLQKIQNIEASTGLKLVAFNALEADHAKIEDHMLEEIKELEKELGLTLVAVS